MSANEIARFDDYRVVAEQQGARRIFVVQLKTDKGWVHTREFDFRTNAERHAKARSKMKETANRQNQ